MSQMLKSSGAMGAATLTSRVLGMVREMFYAGFMGDEPVASAFKLALVFPNMFRRLLGEGALTAAFIPIFKEKEKTAGEVEMWRAANAVISGLVIVASALIGLGLIVVSLALASGSLDPETRLMLRLTRVMFPYMLLVCLAAAFMGMLNARGHFFIPAMGAALLNVVMIASVLFLAPHLGQTLDRKIFGLAIGVVVAGIAQAAFQIPSLFREGFRFRWISPWPNETVQRVLRQMVPATLGVAAFQINVVLTYGLAFWMDKRIVASFDYAVRLMELPQGVFGLSLATYLLPTLSGLAVEKKYPEFRATLGQGLGYLVFVNSLAAALLLSLAEPIVRLLFERGEFNALSTQRASLALTCLAPGLVAFSAVNILARAFYALGDTATPMKISVVCLGLNLVFAFFLIRPFRQGGLGVANTLSAVLNMGLLFYALRVKLRKLEMSPLRRDLLPLLGAATISGLAAWLAWHWWERVWGHANLPLKMGAVFLPMVLATVVYFGLAAWLRIGLAKDLTEAIRAKFQHRP